MTRHMEGTKAGVAHLKIAKDMLKARKWEIIMAYSNSLE